MPTALEILQLNAVCLKPFAIRMSLCQLFLYLAVIVNFAILRVNKQYLTRLQASLANHVAWLEVHHTYFRSHDHQALLRNGVTAGAQTITVEHSACIASVRKEKSGRAVPRFHQYRMIFVEGLEVLAYRVLIVEAFGHEYCHCLRQRESAHHKELEDIVEACRVAHAFLHDGSQVLNVAQCLATQHAFPCPHPSAVAANGVDLAVVGEQSERLCQRPRRECVGGESRMHQGQTARKVRVGQVGEVLSHLHRRQHALVDDAGVAQRADVEVLVVDAFLDSFSYYI